MKKGLFIAIIALAVFWVTIRIFGFNQKGNIMSNEAVFDIHLNTDSLNIDKYFGMPAGTFDKNKHVILCRLPVNTSGTAKPNYQEVKLGTSHIDCNEEYKPGTYVKYDNTELDNSESKLLIVSKYGRTLGFFNEKLDAKNIIAEQKIVIPYKRKRINHLVISLFGVYEFCR